MVGEGRGREAITHIELIERYPPLLRGHEEVEALASLVECQLETGRTHQIRVHAASGLGVPLLGDPVYGPTSPDFPEYEGRAARTMLHSAAISVPRLGREPVAARAPLPVDFAAFGFSVV